MSWLRRAAVADVFADAAGAPALALRDLRVAMGGRVLIERLSMSAAGGELWCVVGPNGAGKSTLLSVLAGLRMPDGGAVALDGHALAAWPGVALARRRAFLPQTLHDTFPMTAHEAVMTGRHPHLARWEWEGEADARAVDAAISALALEPLAQRDVRTLSGGERQRVAMAAVVAQQAPVLLLDEPVAHLDLHQQIAVLRLLRDGCRRQGWLVILTVHDLNLARRYATHALLMDGEGHAAAGPAAAILTPEHCARVLRTPIAAVDDGRRIALIPDDPDDAF
ncbi:MULTISPECIES: ABC transporter ATP-binding protein [Ralstonia solanacearum species complex]|uniref:ATP-binding cassette domain-containing protein n=1 Tax=Ralstonia syzygii TaxID=28097 RepID=A0ABX7ZDI6_9RALS|nr:MULTISPECIES: ABC transporter ATP-binding protein [Ralstonia solanacearum species complex]BEU71376.1 ABC transporter ATP-binding protein [Ralstonia pseudosolanacearum]AMP36894.1 ABC transporter ATP-binding protein [Ralstonia solanacearum]AXV76337.1 ABC transporter ATP-binding protein [Ralstonia solanacearum]AXV85703.1 ABC transporter ATP-binding protein [Ralstonia solanacearum]AXV90346.1 ABC transporter ATP-binding protein [Ralstonia solanacearum]